MSNGLLISADNTDPSQVSLSFQKDDFTEFLAELLRTPREEAKVFHCGFDITPDDIKVLCDKVNHYIQTQNDRLHTEFLAKIDMEDGSDLTVRDDGAFFSTDYIGRCRPIAFQATMTYLIGFNRPDAKKSYERQVVSLGSKDSAPGEFQVRIRSTELTWPPAIMNLLEGEMRGISRRTSGENAFVGAGRTPGGGTKDWRPSLRSSTIGNIQDAFSDRLWIIRPFIFLMSLVMTVMMAAILVVEAQNNDVYIYDPITKAVSLASFGDMVNSLGWERASELSILSREMLRSGEATYAAGEGPMMRSISTIPEFFGPVAVVVCLIIFCLTALFARVAASREARLTGRLFWSRSLVSPRPTPSKWTGIGAGAILAILANLITNVISILIGMG